MEKGLHVPIASLLNPNQLVNPPSAEQMNAVSNGDKMDVDHQQHSESIASFDVETFSSGDAYMLMYNLRHSWKDEGKTRVECNANDMTTDG